MADATESELMEAAYAAGFTGVVPRLIVERYGRLGDESFVKAFDAFVMERRRSLALCDALRDIRDGKDNPCVIVTQALTGMKAWG